MVARAVKRNAEGLADEAVDGPLPDSTQKSIEATFASYYHWELEPRLQPCDSLLGRCKREAGKRAPAMFAAARARSL
eukprot:14007536-Alexandrium_andersonii.AAC.1